MLGSKGILTPDTYGLLRTLCSHNPKNIRNPPYSGYFLILVVAVHCHSASIRDHVDSGWLGDELHAVELRLQFNLLREIKFAPRRLSGAVSMSESPSHPLST